MKKVRTAARTAATLAVLIAVAATAANAAHLARRVGIGYSAGYHAPCNCDSCRKHAGHGHFADTAPGCCEFPLTWRTNTWNGYANEHLPQWYVWRANNPTPYSGYYGMKPPMGLNYPPLPMGFDATTIPIPPPEPTIAEPTPAPAPGN